MELSKADTLYLMMAVRHMLLHEQKPSDKVMYERLFYKLSISHNGKKIRETIEERSYDNKRNALS